MTKARAKTVAYEMFSGHNAASAISAADEMIKSGWSKRDYPAVRLTEPMPWSYDQPLHRSWNFHVHCLDMLDALLAAYDGTMERQYLDAALPIALDWVARHPRSAPGVSDMAWYDRAVGLRAYRLAYLYQAAGRARKLKPPAREALWASLEEHRAELADDSKIRFHNNHGYYQVAGQLALGRRFARTSPAMMALYVQGHERFARMLDVQFTEEGVHREHSPDYHRMVLDTLKGIIRAGLVDDEALRARARLIEEALAWFVYPSGALVNFGDSDARDMRRSAKASRGKWDAPVMQAVSSAGATGGSRPAGAKLFRASGYAVVRYPDPATPHDAARDSYLAQTAAFHSRTHKHADDLSFVWHDRGQSILVDAGRFGYVGKAEQGSELWRDGHWYSHPMRVFVESTRAHNTLEFDGRNFPRKGVKPYGSAIKDAAEADGTFAFETRCKQFGSIWHDRVLALRPREWLVVLDAFTDNSTADHDVSQWFHLAPGHQVAPSDDGYGVALSKGGALLKVASLLPGSKPTPIVAGQEAPVLQGWWSGKELEALPSSAFAFRSTTGARGVLATLFSFTSTLSSDLERSRSNATGRRSRLCWHDDRGAHRLLIRRDAGLSVSYTIGRG